MDKWHENITNLPFFTLLCSHLYFIIFFSYFIHHIFEFRLLYVFCDNFTLLFYQHSYYLIGALTVVKWKSFIDTTEFSNRISFTQKTYFSYYIKNSPRPLTTTSQLTLVWLPLIVLHKDNQCFKTRVDLDDLTGWTVNRSDNRKPILRQKTNWTVNW